jgi:hypothetical protein
VPEDKKPMAAHPLGNKIPDHIAGLFVEPIPVKGGEPSDYWNLVAAIIDEHQPQSSFDWFAVIDLVAKLWEERFYRLASNATMRAGQRRAVEEFLTEIRSGEDRLKYSGKKPNHRKPSLVLP